jgi:hypothetical protein
VCGSAEPGDYHNTGGIINKVISANEAASVIDRVATLPMMDWSFMFFSLLNKTDAQAINAAMKLVTKEKHPSAQVLNMQYPLIAQEHRIKYSLDYGAVNGAEIVNKKGFIEGNALVYCQTLGLSTEIHPRNGKTYLWPLVTVKKQSAPGKYNLRVQKVGHELGAKTVSFIDKCLEQIVELLK